MSYRFRRMYLSFVVTIADLIILKSAETICLMLS